MPYKDPVAKAAYMREYVRKNRDKLSAYHKEKHLRYRATDPNYVLRAKKRSELWQKQHPDRMREIYRKHRAKNAVARRAYARRYAKDHPEVINRHSMKRKFTRSDATRATERAWRTKNKDRVRIMDKNKRAKRAGAVGKCTKAQWVARCVLYDWKCAYCGIKLTNKTVQTEHVIPLARGGTNWPSNLVPACRPCNNKKGIKLIQPRPPTAQSPPSFTSTGAVSESGGT